MISREGDLCATYQDIQIWQFMQENMSSLVWTIGIFGAFQLHFESFHANLKPVHCLNGSLSTGRVVKANKPWIE